MPWNVGTLRKTASAGAWSMPSLGRCGSQGGEGTGHTTFGEKSEEQRARGHLQPGLTVRSPQTRPPGVRGDGQPPGHWCIDLEVEEPCHMGQAARQTIVIGSSWSWPRPAGEPCPLPAVLHQDADSGLRYLEDCSDELEALGEHARASPCSIEEVMEEYEEEGCKKWRGPGCLDLMEVDESLPGELQKCFDMKAVQMLQDAVSKMRSTTYSVASTQASEPPTPSPARPRRGGGRPGTLCRKRSAR